MEDGYLHLMNNQGEILEHIRCPENEFGKELKEKFKGGVDGLMVTILKAMGEEAAISFKTSGNK